MKKIWKIIGGVFFITGLIILFSSFPNITGFVVLKDFSFLWRRILSAALIVVGLIAMSVEEVNAAIRSGGGLEKKLGKGKNVEMHVIFVRHGKRNEEGTLTEEGLEQVKKYGKSLTYKDVIKGYSSPIQRALQTTESIVESAPHKKKLKTKIRKELSISGFSENFNKVYLEHLKKGKNAPSDWYFGLGDKRFDKESPSYKEIAEGFAYLLQRSVKMSNRLYSGSKVDLINGTHGNLPECLLKEIMIRKVNGKKVRGFKSVREIGGTLEYSEPVDFEIKRDEKGEKYITLDFRGKEYDVDMKRLNQLADSYKRKVKGRK